MKKLLLLSYVSIGCAGNVFAIQEKTLMHALLTEEKHLFDDLPVEMQQELGSWILGDHPMVSFLLSKAHMTLWVLDAVVESAQFNPSGDKVLTASQDNIAKIWDVSTGDCLKTLYGVRAEFSSSGEKALVLSSGISLYNNLNIFDVASGNHVWTTLAERHTDIVTTAHFSQKGDKIVTASSDCTSKIWDVMSGGCLHTLMGHTGWVGSAQFNASGDKVVTGGKDSTSKIWNVQTGTCLHTLTGHTNSIVSAQFNGSGDKVVTASWDGTSKIWDPSNGTCLQTLVGHSNEVLSAEFNASGDKVLTGSRDGTAKMWDVSSGRCLYTLPHTKQWPASAHFNRSGDKVITVSDARTVKIWDVANGLCVLTLKGNDVHSAQFNSAEDKVVVASGVAAKIWDLKRMSALKRFLKSEISHRQALLLLAIYETVICRALVKKKRAAAFIDHIHSVQTHKVSFDFNTYPPVQEVFETLPQEIQNIVRPFVIKITPSIGYGNENTKVMGMRS